MPESGRGLNFLWVIDFEYEKCLHHGAFIRYFNFAPELVALGHNVTFAVNFMDRDRRRSLAHFERLKTQGVITDFVEGNFEAPAWRLRAAARVFYPALINIVLRKAQQQFAARIDEIARQRRPDVILISGTRSLFLPRRSRSACAFICDLGDCQTLYARRQLSVRWAERDFRGLIRDLKPAVYAYAREHYYSRSPVMKMMVSPVDKQVIDQIGGNPATSVVILNGVRDGVPRGQEQKIPGRIIFTGNMDFPPNSDAALWFLDHVFPLVLRQRPDACFVIAGANPTRAMLERVSKNVIVTGYVVDLGREIARSEVCVAPMVSGGGFKNKLLEAIANRTSVVASSIAVEFLQPEIRQLLAVADSPADMAEAIMAVWKNTPEAEARAEELHELAMAQFSWAARAAELAELARRRIAESGRGLLQA